MINVYIYRPIPRIMIHKDDDCQMIRMHHSQYERLIKLNINTIQTELQNFIYGKYRFASVQQFNDMWLVIDFNNLDFELSVVNFIAVQLTKKYPPFNKAVPVIHDCKTFMI